MSEHHSLCVGLIDHEESAQPDEVKSSDRERVSETEGAPEFQESDGKQPGN